MDASRRNTTGNPNGNRPYWLVALLLLGVIVLVLAVAFFLDRRLRSPVGIAPVPTSRTTGTPRPAAGTAGPTVEPTAVPTRSEPTATGTPIPTPSPRQQVIQAYIHYWHVYSRALYTLDASPVNAVASDGELTRIEAEVAGFRGEDRAVHVRVTHHYLIVSITGDRARLYDEQLDRSFLINPVTKEPHSAPNKGHHEKDIYFLQKVDGVWKVTKSLRQQG